MDHRRRLKAQRDFAIGFASVWKEIGPTLRADEQSATPSTPLIGQTHPFGVDEQCSPSPSASRNSTAQQATQVLSMSHFLPDSAPCSSYGAQTGQNQEGSDSGSLDRSSNPLVEPQVNEIAAKRHCSSNRERPF